MSKTIVMIISSLESGGAERVVSILGNYWFDEKYNVKILTYDDSNDSVFYSINEGIEIIPLRLKNKSRNILSAVTNNIRRIFTVRRAIIKLQPDVVISYMVDISIITLLAMLFKNIPVIVSEHSDPQTLHVDKVWQCLRLKVYNLASLIVVLNRTSQDWFEERVKPTTVVIPNPIKFQSTNTHDNGNSNSRTMIAVGRLVPPKAYDVLLPAFALAQQFYPEWQLKIFGDGPEKNKLLQLQKDLGLTRNVEFCGVVSDIYREYGQSELFVMSSRSEAFPMALCEAMSCSLCVVSTRFHQSISDLVIEGQNGLLADVEDIEGLADAMKRAMGDEQLRRKMGSMARESMKEYRTENVAIKWEEQFRLLHILQ